MLSSPKQAYLLTWPGREIPAGVLNTPKSEAQRFEHIFCGTPSHAGANCPNCHKPLLLYLTLDASDPRLAIAGGPGSLPLFYCWTCNILDGSTYDTEYYIAPEVKGTADASHPKAVRMKSGGMDYGAPFYYRVNDSSIELIQYHVGIGSHAFPPEIFPISFPGAPAQLYEMNPEAQRLIHQLNEQKIIEPDIPAEFAYIDQPRHQVGGEPYSVQCDTEYTMICPICRDKMPFLATITNEYIDGHELIGEYGDYVQVVYHYCRACRIVGTFNIAD